MYLFVYFSLFLFQGMRTLRLCNRVCNRVRKNVWHGTASNFHYTRFLDRRYLHASPFTRLAACSITPKMHRR